MVQWNFVDIYCLFVGQIIQNTIWFLPNKNSVLQIFKKDFNLISYIEK